MRLSEIDTLKSRFTGEIQDRVEWATAEGSHTSAPIHRTASLKRRLTSRIAPAALRLLQAPYRREIKTPFPFPYNLLCIGERFSKEASFFHLKQLVRNSGSPIKSVLMPGCSFGGEDVQFWLRQNIDLFATVDIIDRLPQWQQIAKQLGKYFRTVIDFQYAALESTPFDDNHFDLVTSEAVLEHVRNLEAAAQEMYRILKPGGWGWHRIGPLYFTSGEDHCIDSYGLEYSYDHLVLDEPAYRQKVNDAAFFKMQPDPGCRFWAMTDQFSFAKTEDYLSVFRRYFDLKHAILGISVEALSFRRKYPERWKQLLAAGLHEHDLLSYSLSIVLRKPTV